LRAAPPQNRKKIKVRGTRRYNCSIDKVGSELRANKVGLIYLCLDVSATTTTSIIVGFCFWSAERHKIE